MDTDPCKQMPRFLKTFIDTLISTSEAVHSEYQYFFYRWLMIELDAISRKCLPKLRQTVKEKQKACDNTSSQHTQVQLLKEKARKAEEALYNAGIGMEHLMRELGQVYECIHAEHDISKVRIPQWASDLPETAANLLLSGLPLEIMNGDTGCVPLSWVKQVFKLT